MNRTALGGANFEPGEQVCYTLTGETGFVTSQSANLEFTFVRLWLKGKEGAVLRDVASSRKVNTDYLEPLEASEACPGEVISRFMSFCFPQRTKYHAEKENKQ